MTNFRTKIRKNHDKIEDAYKKAITKQLDRYIIENEAVLLADLVHILKEQVAKDPECKENFVNELGDTKEYLLSDALKEIEASTATGIYIRNGLMRLMVAEMFKQKADLQEPIQ